MLHYDWLVLIKPFLADFNLSIAIDDLLLEIGSFLRILTLTHRERNVRDIKTETTIFNFHVIKTLFFLVKAKINKRINKLVY